MQRAMPPFRPHRLRTRQHENPAIVGIDQTRWTITFQTIGGQNWALALAGSNVLRDRGQDRRLVMLHALDAGNRPPPVLSTRSNRLRMPASAERHSNSVHTVRRLNELSHRHI